MPSIFALILFPTFTSSLCVMEVIKGFQFGYALKLVSIDQTLSGDALIKIFVISSFAIIVFVKKTNNMNVVTVFIVCMFK